jgi:hypothetical protein
MLAFLDSESERRDPKQKLFLLLLLLLLLVLQANPSLLTPMNPGGILLDNTFFVRTLMRSNAAHVLRSAEDAERSVSPHCPCVISPIPVPVPPPSASLCCYV